jgi:hypothetical protein
MGAPKSIKWLDEPEDKDYLAAHSFLSMLLRPDELDGKVAALHSAPLGQWAAKDILRAAGLPPLKPKRSVETAEKLTKINEGVPISPVLLIAGIRHQLVIADGYHRVSAAYRVDERALVPGRLLWTS